jgi:hypothetical protein
MPAVAAASLAAHRPERAGQQGIGQLALPQLSSTLLQFLARYMGVVVGAVSARAGWLPPRGVVWLQRRMGTADQQLKPTESLVAQAALERRIIRLEPLPATYIQVSSGWARRRQRAAGAGGQRRRDQWRGRAGPAAPISERDVDLLTMVKRQYRHRHRASLRASACRKCWRNPAAE